MPEFIAEHTPRNVDDFTRGYLEAAEWLLDENINRNKLRGFTKAAVREAKATCKDFQDINADLLAATGADNGRNGTDFWLTRNHHGAGFWDRGYGEVGNQLSYAAHTFGETHTTVFRGWITFE